MDLPDPSLPTIDDSVTKFKPVKSSLPISPSARFKLAPEASQKSSSIQDTNLDSDNKDSEAVDPEIPAVSEPPTILRRSERIRNSQRSKRDVVACGEGTANEFSVNGKVGFESFEFDMPDMVDFDSSTNYIYDNVKPRKLPPY